MHVLMFLNVTYYYTAVIINVNNIGDINMLFFGKNLQHHDISNNFKYSYIVTKHHLRWKWFQGWTRLCSALNMEQVPFE